jgi:muramoyltetrapeptide carboxypeptidase
MFRGQVIHSLQQATELASSQELAKSRMPVDKPARLRPGARVGVVAPAGCVERKSLETGVNAIRAAGFQVELSPNIFASNGYLAGTAQGRAQDLLGFFRRRDIDAIFCARGGFGSVQLLPYLSAEMPGYPKIFLGYSDVTILLNWLRQACGIVTFHAPMVAMDWAQGLSAASRAHFWALLMGEALGSKLTLGEVIRPGNVESELMGGCLSLLVTTLGTPYEIDTRGKLLFVEDVGEQPYRVERMLTHLKMAGKLNHLAGVVFGDFTDCEGDGPRGIREVIIDVFGDVSYPVVMGMKAGHGRENFALPLGVRMRLDGARASLEVLETPVI